MRNGSHNQRRRCGVAFGFDDTPGHRQLFVDGCKDARVLIMTIDADFVHAKHDGLFVRIVTIGVSPSRVVDALACALKSSGFGLWC